ncbi:uncharacterized protein [Dermacentor albipictus]|uniref:uncharacterized protein isoform X2 n=2 Tax=Dermacentor albipictus TaxID=60249 RepID=UPI0038FD2CFA
MDEEYDALLNILVIGEQSSGKTCLMLRFASRKVIRLNGSRIKLNVVDTMGQERFHSITAMFYRGADGIIVTYDVTNQVRRDQSGTDAGRSHVGTERPSPSAVTRALWTAVVWLPAAPPPPPAAGKRTRASIETDRLLVVRVPEDGRCLDLERLLERERPLERWRALTSCTISAASCSAVSSALAFSCRRTRTTTVSTTSITGWSRSTFTQERTSASSWLDARVTSQRRELSNAIQRWRSQTSGASSSLRPAQRRAPTWSWRLS